MSKRSPSQSQALLIDVRCYQSEHQSHSHDYHQLVLPVYGELALEIDGKGGVVDNRHAAVISAQNRHGFAAEDANRFIVADVPAGWANMLDTLPPFIELSPALVSYIQFIAARLEQSAMSAQTRQQILTLLLDLMAEQFQQSVNIDKRVSTARHYLDDNLAQKVTLDEVASVAHLSVRQLSHLFKGELGLSPLQYLRQQRMKQAAHMLTNTDTSIQMIAEAVGYDNLAAFSHRFGQHFGKAPSYYRRNDKK